MPNLAVISGSIDSDIRRSKVGTPPKDVVEFRVNDGSTWISVKCWEATAQRDYQRGQNVVVHGRIATRSYDKDGAKVYVTEVIASAVDVIGAPAPAPAQPAPSGDLFG